MPPDPRWGGTVTTAILLGRGAPRDVPASPSGAFDARTAVGTPPCGGPTQSTGRQKWIFRASWITRGRFSCTVTCPNEALPKVMFGA